MIKEHSAEYSAWCDMKNRCRNPNFSQWKDYGGRGIVVCRRWQNSFKNFLADMGKKPSRHHTLDRKDTDGDYCPNNCRWATTKTQQRNRRNNRRITFRGETKCLAAWAEEYGISTGLFWVRLKMGWTIKRALTTPASSYVETFTHNGETKSVFQWAKEFGLGHQLVHQRRTRDGWTLERALLTPKRVLRK